MKGDRERSLSSFRAFLWAGLAAAVAVLLMSAPAPARTQEEIDLAERTKTLNQENRRLLNALRGSSQQLKGSYAKKAALRKLRQVEANYEELIAINRRQQTLAGGQAPVLQQSYGKLEAAYREIKKTMALLKIQIEKKR